MAQVKFPHLVWGENFSYELVACYEFLLTVIYLITIMQPIFKRVFSPRLAQDFLIREQSPSSHRVA